HIDVVDTDTGTAHNSQTRHCFHQSRGDFGFTTNDEAVEVCEGFAQSVRVEARSFFDEKTGTAQRLQAAVAHVISNKNPQRGIRHKRYSNYSVQCTTDCLVCR